MAKHFFSLDTNSCYFWHNDSIYFDLTLKYFNLSSEKLQKEMWIEYFSQLSIHNIEKKFLSKMSLYFY